LMVFIIINKSWRWVVCIAAHDNAKARDPKRTCPLHPYVPKYTCLCIPLMIDAGAWITRIQ
jgi:hypothetical protein